VDQHYRTMPDKRHTGIIGSSMGGLISSYAISRYPEVFGVAGIFSPAYWLAPQAFADSGSRPPPHGERIYFYAGGSESETMVPDMKRMVAVLRRSGLPAHNLEVQVNPVGRHNEARGVQSFRARSSGCFAVVTDLSSAPQPAKVTPLAGGNAATVRRNRFEAISADELAQLRHPGRVRRQSDVVIRGAIADAHGVCQQRRQA